MAFNPFHSFRKHKKVLFAGLTIVCMMTFVLAGSSSFMTGGDFFSDVSRWITGRARQTDVATINGKAVSERQIYSLRFQRMMANQFMFEATGTALGRMEQTEKAKLDKSGSGKVDDRMVGMHLEQNPDYVNLASRFRAAQMNQQQRIPMYFSGGLGADQLMDFMVWLKEADRLGINLTDKDVDREFTRLTRNLVKPSDSGRVEANIRADPRFRQVYSPENLINSLRDEFRVQLAQAALTGFDPGTIFRVAAPATPDEFWTFFKDFRTTVEVGLIPVKGEAFLDQVKDKPTEQEIKELYGKYRDTAYSPDLATPAFKQAQRVQIEWIAAKSDQPVFVKMAANDEAVRHTAQRIGLAFGNIASLAGPAVLGAQVSEPGAIDMALIMEYDKLKWLRFRAPSWTDSWVFPPYPLHDSSLKQPIDIAAAVGQTFGAVAGTPAAPLLALSNYEALAARREIADAVQINVTRMLSGLPAGPASTLPTLLRAVATSAAVTNEDDFYPLSQVKDWLVEEQRGTSVAYVPLREKLAKEKARSARNNVLQQIDKEIQALEKSRDKTMLKKYIPFVIERYGLETGKSAPISDQYENRFTLKDDPGLKPLKDEYVKPPSEDAKADKFDTRFLGQSALYTVEHFPDSWRTNDQAYLYWKVAEKPARIVSLDDPKMGKAVRAEVEKAWRLLKARELAKKDAERVAKLAQETKGDVKKLRDLSMKETKKELIELLPLARVTREQSFDPKVAYKYAEPRVQDDRVPYSGDEVSRQIAMFLEQMGQRMPNPFGEKIVTLRDKEKGATVVLPDKPEATYYVAVLIDKRDPSEKEFYEVYRDAASNARRRDPLLARFEQERQIKYLRDVVERLRKDAKVEINEENFKRLRESASGSDD